MNPNAIRVVLADDHPLILEGIRHELTKSATVSVVGLARSSSELIPLLSRTACDVLVSDYVMPGGEYGDGITLFSFIRRRFPKVQTVILTMMESAILLQSLIDIGNRCLLSKVDKMEHLHLAVRAAYVNGRYLSPRISEIIMPAERPTRGVWANAPLSSRELEVVRFYVSGLTVNEIADRLSRSKKTISSQKVSAMAKLGIKRDADLVRYGLENGLVPPTKSEGIRKNIAHFESGAASPEMSLESEGLAGMSDS